MAVMALFILISMSVLVVLIIYGVEDPPIDRRKKENKQAKLGNRKEEK